MTHSINGNIVIVNGSSFNYNSKLANTLIANYLKKFGEYFSNFDSSIIRKTEYYWIHGSSPREKDEEREFPIQPFIYVFDKPLPFREWTSKIDKKSLSSFCSLKNPRLIVKVESGSHVGCDDTGEAKEIYDTSRKIYNQLAKEKRRLIGKGKLELLFDDEKRFFTSQDFLGEINNWEKLLSEISE